MTDHDWTIVITPSGRAILSTERDIPRPEVEAIQDYFRRWRESDEGLVVISRCRVEKADAVVLRMPGLEDLTT